MRKIRIFIAGLAAMAAAATIGGTWAVWTQRLLAKNEYMTSKYSTFLREEFESPEDWLPGEETRKAVWVKNESTIPIIAKITMNQNWVRREDVTAMVVPPEGGAPKEIFLEPRKGEPLPVIFDAEDGRQYAAVLNFNKDGVVVLADKRASEPGLRLDIPEVSSPAEAAGKWLLLSETPNEDGNFTFYYMGEVQPGEETPVLLSSVEMNPQLETTVTGSYTYYEKEESAVGGYKKITVNTVNSKYGYDCCHFTLGVNMQTVQSTKDAVKTIFKSDEVSEYIAGYIAGSGVFDDSASPVKTLYFRERDGVMSYTPYRTSDGRVEEGNWFMSFTNMIPGGVYKDKLNIENGSFKNYRLYMRIIPRAGQTTIQDELLKKIAMKVYFKDKLIYDGDVTGYHYSGSGNEDMQGLVPLGVYRRGSKDEIRVELVLDPDIGLNDDGTYKYADVLTKVDWEFMVQEVRNGGGGNPPGGGGGGGTTPGGPGDNPEPGVEIPDEPVPLDGVTIEDGDVPLSLLPDPEVPLGFMVPQTGDEFPVVPLAVTVVVSLLLMMGFGFLGFGKKKKAEQ